MKNLRFRKLSKIKAPADLVSGEDPLFGSQMAIVMLHPHMMEG